MKPEKEFVWPSAEWIAMDEEYHSEECTRFDIARAEFMEGAPVRGEDGFEGEDS